MIKKILSFIALLLLGTALAFFLYDELFHFMKDIYVWASDGVIQFTGKHILIPSPLGVVAFGLSFATISYGIIFNPKKKVLRAILWLLSFCVCVFGFTYIDSIRAMANCTQCSGDIFYLDFNEIRITGILITASIISSLPSLFAAMNKLKR